MTRKIQEAVCEWLVKAGSEAICENFRHNWEMDIASMTKSDLLFEFEVKISRSDFMADKKRKQIKFQHYEQKISASAPNYFSYVCPDGLIKKNEIPTYAGLYYYSDNKITQVKYPKKIHKVKVNKVNKEKILIKMLRLNIQRKYLGCSMLTYLNRQSRKMYDDWQKDKEIIINELHEKSLFIENE